MRKDLGIFLFFTGMVLFGWPLISIFKHGLAIYLFIIWLLFIALIFVATRFPEKEDGGG
jgi:hypothetical protein